MALYNSSSSQYKRLVDEQQRHKMELARQQRAFGQAILGQQAQGMHHTEIRERIKEAKPGFIYDACYDKYIPDPNAPIRLKLQNETDAALKDVLS